MRGCTGQDDDELLAPSFDCTVQGTELYEVTSSSAAPAETETPARVRLLPQSFVLSAGEDAIAPVTRSNGIRLRSTAGQKDQSAFYGSRCDYHDHKRIRLLDELGKFRRLPPGNAGILSTDCPPLTLYFLNDKQEDRRTPNVGSIAPPLPF